MIERVAKAISGAPFPSKESLRKARAAIEAMRDATNAMVEAAYEDHDTKSAAEDSNKDFAASCYRAMIDAALGDGK
jgi:hypothetical protein